MTVRLKNIKYPYNQIHLPTDPVAGLNRDIKGGLHSFYDSNGNIYDSKSKAIWTGASIGGGASYLLDTYPAFAAYSTRQLAADATNCMRVRRASDALEINIPFTDGWLDESAIVTHCGVALGYVVTWYDQSGNAYDASNASAGFQPQIYDGLTVLKSNTKPSLYFGAGSANLLSVAIPAQAQPFTAFSVVSHVNGIDTGYPFYTTSPTSMMQFGTTGTFLINAGTSLSHAGGYSGQLLVGGLFNSTTSISRVNGSQVAAGNAGTNTLGTTLYLGNSTTARAIDEEQELVIYTSDQTANFAAIEANINAAFSVYA